MKGSPQGVAVSQGVGLDLQKRLRMTADRLRVIHNPIVDHELTQRAMQAAPHAWLTQHEIPVFVAVGRLVPIKDHATLLRAFALLRRRRPARLILLGEGPERPRLERLSRDLGLNNDVAMPGFCTNPAAAMRRAAAYVLSSRVESLSNTLIEALACGCPVVATDCPCGPREILRDGRFGTLVACEDAEALSSAMHTTLDQAHNRDQLRARANDFSFDHIIPQYLDAIGKPSVTGKSSEDRSSGVDVRSRAA